MIQNPPQEAAPQHNAFKNKHKWLSQHVVYSPGVGVLLLLQRQDPTSLFRYSLQRILIFCVMILSGIKPLYHENKWEFTLTKPT